MAECISWDELVKLINVKTGVNYIVKYVNPSNLDNYLCNYFELEKKAFRDELRYSLEELTERINKNNLLFILLFSNEEAKAMVLGYEQNPINYYLDSLAVKDEGKGLGTLLLNSLISWIKVQNYRKIVLDTEHQNERGLPLVRFYQKNGFRIAKETEDGNVTMEYLLETA